MTARGAIVFATALALGSGAAAGPARAFSAVFAGDPVAPSGAPYEIMPGKPLVQPGADGVLGTADDVVNPAVVGDVDLVVRSGDVTAGAVIADPALRGGRAALPTGVAGPPNAGGTSIPFTVFLSDGLTTVSAPAGALLAAPDMNGIPVVVAAFADLDGDGWIGPTQRDAAAGADLHLEVRELEPVGRAAALFDAGVARGRIAVRAGLPASQGGLTIALAAMALTGPFEPQFFDGAIPSGPGVTTALPFIPQRDLNRLIRDRPVAAGPDTTLQQLVQFAALPAPDAYALPLDGSAPTIDGAIVNSQPAVRVSFRAGGAAGTSAAPLEHVVLGRRAPASLVRWRLLPVDRFENPADPPPGFSVVLRSDPSLQLIGQRGARRARALSIGGAAGRRLLGRLTPGTADGTRGTLRVERDGIVVATLGYVVDAHADRPRADVVVPSRQMPTIQAAIDAANDRNGDGVVAIGLRAGLFRESVAITRALALLGAGDDLTILQGDGTASVVAAAAPGIAVHGVTAVGGSSGFSLSGAGARLVSSAAWRNLGTGVALSGQDAEVWASAATENGGAGVLVGAAAIGAACSDSALRGNHGTGVAVQSAANVRLVANLAIENAGGGFLVNDADAPRLEANRSVINVGSGAELQRAPGAQVVGNLCAVNDEDGLSMERVDDARVTGNTLESNNGYGIFVRRSQGADFSAAAGEQPPPGDNLATDNRKGDVFVRTD